jgi:uncharacterized membrane protein YhhN
MNEVISAFPPEMLLWMAILLSGVATIVCEEGGWRRGVYLFKPLTTILILVLALGGEPGTYRALVCAGLAFSLAGDVFLMLPTDRFVAGLVSFLIAHLLYIAAFVTEGVGFTWWAALPFALYAAVLLRVLLPRVGDGLRAPVLVYAVTLAAMAWLAAEVAIRGVPGAEVAAVGAALFVVSDSALAVNRFVRPFRLAQTVVLLTYFAAQTLIAWST